MPELPDLAVVADACHGALAGRVIEAASTPGPLAVRGTPDEVAALVGQRLEAIRRRGKFVFLELARDRIVVSPMLTGRIGLARPGARTPPRTAFVLRFGSRPAGCPADAAPWTRGADWLPGPAEAAELRYRDATQMGKVYVVLAGTERPIPGLSPGELGPEADDPDLTLETWREQIRPHRGELKNLLRNQSFVAGIGNAYADEILHAARLLPFRKRSTLAPDEVDDLYRATRATISAAIDVLRQRVPPTFDRQVRDFLAVHDRGGQPCPRCGTRISEVRAGGFITSYCRGCQR